MTDRRIAARFPGLKEASKDNADEASKLARVTRGRRSVKACKMLGHDFVWRILSGSEQQECVSGAIERFRQLEIPPEMRTYNDLEQEISWQILWRTMRDPEVIGTDVDPYPRSYADSVSEVREELSTDERDVFINSYMDYEEEINPAALGLDIFHQQIGEILKKNDETNQPLVDLMNFGSHSLASFLLTMVRPLLTSPSHKSTSTSIKSTKSEDDAKTQSPRKTGSESPSNE